MPTWKVVRHSPPRAESEQLPPHRLGFVLKRPKKRLLKAKPFVLQYRTERRFFFFVDEAHFRADADLASRERQRTPVGREGHYSRGGGSHGTGNSPRPPPPFYSS